MNETKLEKIIRYLLYLAALTPLIFIQGFYYPFIITKTLYFRLLIQLALSLYLLLLAINYKEYKPRFNPALILVLVFLAVNFLAAIFGPNFYKSFFSNFERLEGVIGLIYLSAYLFLLLHFFKTKKDWLLNIRLFLAVSLLVSLYGIIQRFNILPVFEAGTSRAASTLGNAAFLGGFMLLSIGLGVYYWFNESEKKYRIFGLITIAFNLFVLFLTLTRGAILGLIGGIFIFLILNIIFSSGRLKKYSLVCLATFLLLAGAFLVFRKNLADSKISVIQRLATISITEGTAKDRLLVWGWAIKGFRERPLLGVGPENFDVVYNKYYTPAVSEDWFDRTHNIYLDQLAGSGLIGLAAYLSIYAYLFYLLLKKRREDYFIFSSLSALLVAYAIHNFFVFDVLSTALIYFFIIGLISFRKKEEPETSTERIRPAYVNFSVLILAVANIFLLYYLIYLPMKINRNIYVGYRYALADTELSHQSFSTALKYRFGSPEAALQLSQMYDVLEADPTTKPEDLEKYYNLTIDKLRFALNNYPLEVRVRVFLGQQLINHYQSQEELEEAETVLARAVELSPTRPEAVYLLFNAYLAEGKKERAIATMENLIKELPDFGEPKVLLGASIYKSDPAKAKEYFDRGIKQEYRLSKNVLTKLIGYLLDNQRYGEAIPYLEEIIALEPNRYDYRLDLSKLYYLTGDLDKAIEQVNIVNEKAPATLKNFQDYLNLLTSEYNKNK